ASLLRTDKNGLTHRQLQLMNLVAQGLTNKEIAAHVNLSEFTVKNHIQRVMRHMDAENRHEAVDLIRATGHFVAS
ncbi:MAG: LuxR C-terminal-related transcriptional regulator, partial [Candidatus Acidiferrum sp.]